MSADRKFWSDDFDMDLPKVIPDARDRLGEHAELELVTHGHETHGRLNHPTVWNHYLGAVSFFGRGSPHKPEHYWTSDPLVSCTLWEAVRDAWVHDNVILLEGSPIWRSQWRHFQPLMWAVRGWRPLPAGLIEMHQDAVRRALERCRANVERLISRRGSTIG